MSYKLGIQDWVFLSLSGIFPGRLATEASRVVSPLNCLSVYESTVSLSIGLPRQSLGL